MGTAVRFIWAAAWRTMAFLAVVTAGLWWMNRSTGWDANNAINSPENFVTGRAGLVVVGLAQPETFDPKFFDNFLDKLFTQVIPWPINVLAGNDNGIVLMDPAHPYAPTRFEPKTLADIWGRTVDIDGTPWIEKYKRGELRWEKPSATVPHDTGFFLYPERKQGMRMAAAKTAAKARYIYYARLPGGVMPHYRQTVDLANAAIAQVKAEHPIVAGEFADAFDKGQKEAAVRRVLDSGIDTLILASVQPIHSDFEELQGSFAAVHKIVEEWRKAHGNKKVRIVVAPYLASQPSFDRLWLNHFAKVVPQASTSGQSAMGIITLHGLPVSLIDKDSWTPRVKTVTDRLKPQMEAILKAKGYGNVLVAPAQEGFGDKIEDPDNKIVSVAELFARARTEKRAVAVALPIEFLAENTDTLFAHSALMFDGLPGYTSYQGPPAGTNWSQPFVRSFKSSDTLQIYAGTPGGANQALASQALASGIGTLFRK
jgi:hypothetical protein